MAALTAAISSSAWKVTTPKSLYRLRLCSTVAGRRDGVGALEQRPAGELAGGDEAERQRRVAGDVAVGARLELRRRHLVGAVEELDGVRVAVAGLQRPAVGLGVGGLELLRDPVLGDRGVPVEQPVGHAQGEEVLAAIGLLGAEAEVLDRALGQLGELDGDDLEAAPASRPRAGSSVRSAFSRSRFVNLSVLTMTMPPGLRSPMLRTRAAGFMATRTPGASPGVKMVVGGEVDLEAADAGQGARRGPDLGREVGEGRQVVALQRRGVGELRSCELHPVARVAREADDDIVQGLDRLVHLCSDSSTRAPDGVPLERRVGHAALSRPYNRPFPADHSATGPTLG